MNKTDKNIYERALERERNARKQVEKIFEEKSKELYHLTQELKKANEQLKSQVHRKDSELRGVFENLVDAYVLMDIKGNVIEMNEAAKKLFGYDLKEESINVVNLIYKEDYQYAMESFHQLMKKGSFIDYQARIQTKTQDVRSVHINASLIYDQNQKPVAAQGIVRDITDKLFLEEQKQQLLSTLEKNNQELKDYAHVVSHDLKSPLRSIYALVNWLKEDHKDVLNPSGEKHIEMIEGTLEKMENLINGILSYSSAGNRSDLTHQNIDLKLLINDLVKTIYKPEHIQINISSSLPIIYADPTRMQQLFQNLISNAIQHIDKEVGLIEIEANTIDQAYHFSIKDNGIGIDPRHHDAIFKIFKTMSDHKSSTGIGLSIVKKIVDLYEGEIWLESEINKGTTFFIKLPKTKLSKITTT